MKRYLLFAYAQFYPSGGWSDFIDSFDSIQEVNERVEKDNHWWKVFCGYMKDKSDYSWKSFDYVEVIDTRTGNEVELEIQGKIVTNRLSE